MNGKRNRAKCLLLHYFDLAGVISDNDNRVEIEEIVDACVEAAKAEIRAELPEIMQKTVQEATLAAVRMIRAEEGTGTDG